MNDLYFRQYLDVIRRYENQRDYLDFLRQPHSPPHRHQLARAAECLARTAEGLLVNYGHTALEWYEQQATQDRPKYIFHGTSNTWEIIESWQLQSNQALTGKGIYFGRDYKTSMIYTDHCAKRRTNDRAIPSIFVFRNEHNLPFRSEDVPEGNKMSYEYILEGDHVYSLDTLEAIVFHDSSRVMDFGIRFEQWDQHERKQRFLDGTIKLYDYSLQPLNWPELYQRFSSAFTQLTMTWRQVGVVDPELYFWPVTRPSWSGSEAMYEFVVERAKQALPNQYGLIALAKHFTGGDGESFERFIRDPLKWNEDVYIDVLLAVLDKLIIWYEGPVARFKRLLDVKDKGRIKRWVEENDRVVMRKTKVFNMERTRIRLNFILRHLS
jgi:hypothetical protein